MPKIVDHDERRREVAQAVLRVVARNGVAGVTLNEVAEESGWSRGVLTHYFGAKDALLEAALRLGMREISENLADAAADPDPWRALQRVLEEIVPLDERRLAFSRVYTSFMAEAMVAEHLQGYFSYNHEAWRKLITDLLFRAESEGAVVADHASAASALAALAEGLRARALFDVDLTPDDQRRQLCSWVAYLVPKKEPA